MLRIGSTVPILMFMWAAAVAAAPVKLSVQADKPAHAVSPTLYGIFFEEINRAGDGGLYAEMVQNRSFEDSPTEPLAWRIEQSGVGAEVSLDRAQPMDPDQRFNPSSLRVHLPQGGEVRLINEGFKGMAVRKGQSYRLSLMVRGGVDEMNVALRTPDGTELAQAKISRSSDWKNVSHTLTAGGDADEARLVITCKGMGEVRFDMISLLPRRTWKGSGLRSDLAGMLEDLQPAFMRFPGGCWVEGDTLAGAYRWKETIGDVAGRRTQYNLWRYHSTHGLGYHEYLQLAEDLGAEPLFVINCGMSHREVAPMSEMGQWVQDALDAIEYANGPADSKWGAVRAKNGRSKPFQLRYIQIGNENGGREYDQRYALFYDAIKKQYPQMRIVANEWRGRPSSRPIEILDEHYYNTPGFFISNADRYDSYERAGPKIYVGEYAVTRGSGQGNLIAALGEAAFMTGLERNSDVVVMASYAPLFANVHYKAWNPDLICFDASRVYGTPSYYVQRMFSHNRPDVVLPAQLTIAEPPAHRSGGVGVGTWLTQAEFKDLKVTAGEKVIFDSDFPSGGMKGFHRLNGTWAVRDGALRQSGNAEGAFAIAGGDDGRWDGDYTYSLKARKLAGDEGFLVVFHHADDDNYVMWNIGGWGNQRHQIEVVEAGAKSQIGRPVQGAVEPNRWYDIRIETRGEQIKCFLDDQLVHEVTRPAPKPLHVTAGRKGEEIILKVVNVSPDPQETDVGLSGMGKLPIRIGATVLTSAGPEDENSLEQPTKVAPAERELMFARPTFTHTFPRYSVTVMRIRPAGSD